jgi:hypothetical protein
MFGMDNRTAPRLKGLVTDADLAEAEQLWPGLQAFLFGLPSSERPETFLNLVWRFETARQAA